LLAAAAVAHARAADPVDADDLRRGLVATYRDDVRPAQATVTRLEPAVALALKPGESPNPRLDAGGGTAVWRGYVNVLRGGAYHFRVELRGRFRLTVAGKEALAAEAKGARPASKEGPEVELEAGVHPFTAEFTRLPGAARVELRWRSPFFRDEPVPYDALGHLPGEEDARLAADTLAEHGRFLVEEHGCARCHRPAAADRVGKTLASREGPDLTRVGGRVRPGWLYAWLGSPRALRPATVMPEMFTKDEAGDVERYAVARYLATLGGPVPAGSRTAPADELRASAIRGQRLFHSVGCVACHGAEGVKDRPAEVGSLYGLLSPTGPRFTYPLGDLAAKTTPGKLAEYLANPRAVDPGGRMPGMLLNGDEARDLARFLCSAKTAAAAPELPPEPAADKRAAAFARVAPDSAQEEFGRLSAADQWADLGKRLVGAKGCANCHQVTLGTPEPPPAKAALADLAAPAKQHSGCLADEAAQRGAAPNFPLDAREREAVRAFLRDGLSGVGSPAPAHAARVAIKRFNCLACHSRDGEGGIPPELAEDLRRYEKAENAEALLPPTLTGIGHKLRTPWLRQVLTAAGRARPWMGLRMPQFGEAQVGKLPEALAALEGAEPDDTVHKVPLNSAKIEAGRQLVGKSAFGCVSCHDLSGIANTGTRGPDLATTNQRVRYDWYLRWLEQPQRMQPGTRMPSVFAEGKSPLDRVLSGRADLQAEAMWAYLSLGAGLPLPEGMEPPKGLTLAVKDRPVVLRTFMPDAGSRAIAVGFPGGVSVAFDAQTCRLAYAWSGNFLDASPVWADRGGNPAKVLGARLWTAPAGCPVGLRPSEEPPDFAARAKDPAYGATPPEGQLYDGPACVRFAGYTTDKGGVPTFRYRLGSGPEDAAGVSERAGPLRSPAGLGVARRFELRVPARQAVWLLAGETGREPRLLDASGAALPLDLKAGRAEVPVAGRLLVLPQEGGRVVVLAAATAPEGSVWRLQRGPSGWRALLRTPAAGRAGRVDVELHVWSPYRDDPGLLRDLLTAK
jgi:mono/diheme cytochrome c family protein